MPTQDRVIIGFPLYSKARKENPSKNDEKSTFPNSFQSDQGQPLRLPAPLRDPYPSARARHTPLVLPFSAAMPRPAAVPPVRSLGWEGSINREIRVPEDGKSVFLFFLFFQLRLFFILRPSWVLHPPSRYVAAARS